MTLVVATVQRFGQREAMTEKTEKAWPAMESYLGSTVLKMMLTAGTKPLNKMLPPF